MGFEVRVIDFILLYSSFSFFFSYLLFITLPFEGVLGFISAQV